MIKSNLGSTAAEKKPLKLTGFAITKPKPKVEKPKVTMGQRRTISNVPKVSAPQAPVTQQQNSSVQTKVPIQDLPTEQKIQRAKQAWEKVRVKALDRLRIDQTTRQQLKEIREHYAKSADPLAYSDYQQKLKDTLGESNYTFLWNARETFKSRVFERAQIEIGPHLGEL